MTTSDIRQSYLDFFTKKGCAVIPSASLLPDNDPTTLFTGSGMQPMVPYLLGETHPLGKEICDSQKCFRSQDIEDVGDNRHTTFFEMLGNWSLGSYFKDEQIPWMFEWLTKEIGLDPNRIYVTVFEGDDKVERDETSITLWKQQFESVGIDAKVVDNAESVGLDGGRIFPYGVKENWWSRSGVPANMPVGEPGGPDSEMFWDFGARLGLHEASEFKNQPCHVACDCGRFLEIGNNVFMQFSKTEQGFENLPQQNVDFGGGLERIAAAKIDSPDVYNIDLFDNLRAVLQQKSGKTYGAEAAETNAFRVVLDHLRGAVFLTADGAPPSNKDQGYFTRRLLRRAIRFGGQLGLDTNFCKEASMAVINTYTEAYPELTAKQDEICKILDTEETQFRATLKKGEKELNDYLEQNGSIDGAKVFYFYETFGFPKELTEELLAEKGMNIVNPEGFDTAKAVHSASSKTASAGKFKGGLAEHTDDTTRLHTATHLLNAALRQVLGDHVQQKGSNITAERLRFDFSHPEKMTPEQKEEVTRLVNEQIKANHAVGYYTTTPDEAKAAGAIGVFDDRYEGEVKVYQIGDGSFSKEICGGPHVAKTGMIGTFRIKKEESSSSGVRRIKAVIEGGDDVEVAEEIS
jgi:alanyl-tRNA synthetase